MTNKTTNDSDDDEIPDGLMLFGGVNSRIKSRTMKYLEHTIFIDTPIGSPSEYRNEIYTILNAGENEEVVIHLNTPGGRLDTAISIINAIQNSNATVTGIISGECASAGGLIFLACDNFVVLPHSVFMAHSASYGAIGKVNDVFNHTSFTTEYMGILMSEMYKGFLSTHEIQQLKEGKEFWFNSDEVLNRLHKRSKFIQSEIKKQQKKEKLESQKLEE